MSFLLCSMCDKLIDLETAVTIHQASGGKKVITDQDGVAHVLFNARSTAQKMRYRKQVAPKVLLVPKAQPEPVETIEVPGEYKPPVYEALEPPAVPTISPAPAPLEQPVEQPTELIDDGFVQAIVHKWSPEYGNGIAKVEYRYRTASLYNIMVNARDVVTFGTLKVDSLIRCRVGEPDPGFRIPRALEISIFQDQD